ncbi:peptide-methionine (S)-S-oxide reductase MsrA [soil metagenome]
MRRLILAFCLASAGSAAAAQDLRTAVVAGGCFWCVESDFDKVEGVVETLSGYTGGHVENPTYRQVTSETTGHYEAVRITFDAEIVGYRDILETFWRTVDPTDDGGQFCDRGSSYRTAIFAGDAEEAAIAEETKGAAESALGQPVVTPILDAATFWPAEDYHQNYYQENSLNYSFYRRACGRDARVQSLWGEAAFQGLGS